MRYSFGGIILVLIGLLMLLDNLDVLSFGRVMSTYWPLFLIVWGFLILRKRNQKTFDTSAFTERTVQAETPNELIHESNAFGDIFLTITSTNFKGGSVSTTFGDTDIDLSKATFAEGDHILRVHSVFGNSRIILPPLASVAVSASTTFGKLNIFGQVKEGIPAKIEIAKPEYAIKNTRLRIVSNTTFGNIVIS